MHDTRACLFGLASLAASLLAQPVAWPALPRYEPMTVPLDNPMTEPKVELGRMLFFDPRLSGDGSTSCASCHRPDHGFTDPRVRTVAAYGVEFGRACPTLWNVGYQQAFFWEGAGPSLERAVTSMWTYNLAPGTKGRAGPADVVTSLNAIAGYRKAFARTFGDDATEENVPKAIAAFLRTLVADRSAWVRFRQGETAALSPRAREGWALFDGKAGCTNCHNGMLLTDLQYHNVGIGMDEPKPQPGRFVVTKNERDRGAFKTPSLVGIADTAPYFHDGSAATLEEAVDVMAGGGRANPRLDGVLKPIPLDPREKEALLAFLRELTVPWEGRPPVLP
jgi:cytochrome c peroxidase